MLLFRSFRAFRRLLLLSAALGAFAGRLSAQADSGAFIIRQDGRDIGREDFVLRDDRGPGISGSTIITTARYPVLSPGILLRGRLELGTDGSILSLRLDVQSGRQSSYILAEGGASVITVRGRLPAGEVAHEYPGGAGTILLDDSLFAWYAAAAHLATDAGRRLRVIYPRTGARAALTARRQAQPDGGAQIQLAGDITGTIWLDAAGRLQRLQFPARNLDVVRLPH